MEVWKEIIRPGEYFYRDADTGKPEKLLVSKAGVQHLYESGKSMLASGLSIPIPLEHQKTLAAMTESEKAASQLLSNAGWVKDYRMRPGDRLYGLCDIPDRSIYDKLPTTIKYTSPWINSFTDGNGRQWNGVISHLALTSRPRITQQEPFNLADAAFSLAGAKDLSAWWTKKKPASGLLLSEAGRLDLRDGKLTPHRAMAFSIWSGAALAEDFPPKKEEKSEGKPPEKKEGSSEGGEGSKKEEKSEGKEGFKTPSSEGDEGPMAGEDLMASPGDDEMTLEGILREVISALWDIELPEDTDESNLCSNLLKGLMAHLKATKGGMMPEPEPDMTNQPPNNLPPNPGQGGAAAAPVTQESPPMYMSLEEIGKITDPTAKKFAEAMFSMQGELSSLRENAFDGAKARRQSRIDALCKRVKTPEFKAKLELATKSATLAISKDGTVQDSMAAMLDMMETAVNGMPDLPTILGMPSAALGGVQVEPQPREHSGEVSEERRQEIIAELSRNAGLATAPPAPVTAKAS